MAEQAKATGTEMKSPLDDSLKDYLRTAVNRLEGMINPPAAWLSAILCRIQHDMGILSDQDSCFVEIGVFKGLFLALLDESTTEYSFPIVGIDPFMIDGQDLGTVTAGLAANGTNMSRISLVKALSNETDAFEPLLQGKKAHLIHVDGSHRLHDVVHDLHLADRLVADDGIVIADDFPKQWQLEVLEAVILYLHSDNPQLVPFAVAGTKLYLCRKEMTRAYQQRIEQYAYSNQDAGSCAQLVDHLENHQQWRSYQPLRGSDVLMF